MNVKNAILDIIQISREQILAYHALKGIIKIYKANSSVKNVRQVNFNNKLGKNIVKCAILDIIAILKGLYYVRNVLSENIKIN